MTPVPGAAQARPSDGVLRAFRLPMRRVLVVAGSLFAVAVPIGTAAGWLLAGSAVGWGILLGLAIPAVFLGLTVVLGLLVARFSNVSFAAIVLAGWFVKMLLLMGVLVVLRPLDFYSVPALFGALVVGVIGWLVAEGMVVLRSSEPYVAPERSAAAAPVDPPATERGGGS